MFDDFRKQHRAIEDRVRKSGVEYAIVRAPERVIETRRGSVQPLTISQAGRPSNNGLGFIGTLDFAEAVVAAPYFYFSFDPLNLQKDYHCLTQH